jgi:hypothetical protein
MSIKRCPSCGGKLKVIDVPLGFGSPALYLCQNGHKVEGNERIYQSPTEWFVTPLKVVEKWSRWDDELTREYIKGVKDA